MIKLITLLGNPGKQYEKTRHNIGWMIEPYLSFSSELRWKEKYKGLLSEYQGCYLLKPLTFMNKSGQSVRKIVDFYKIDIEAILIVHDDIELSFGQIKTKRGGGLAGHNGLRSAAQELGTKEFRRLAIGIGRPVHGTVSSYVLGRFSAEEEPQLPGILKKAASEIESLVFV